MDALILAAGYAKRLGNLTKNFPKPLLKIDGTPVITHIVNKIQEDIDHIHVITNEKYHHHFVNWKDSLDTEINVINDGTETIDNKLGAIGDINFAINQANLQGPLLIIGGDNLFDFNLENMLQYYKKVKKDLVSLAEEDDIETLKQKGLVKIDDNKRIIFFEEKPENPFTNLYTNCLYLYTPETLKLIPVYMREEDNHDQPGRFLQWLYPQKDVRGYLNNGNIVDIGTKKTLQQAKDLFEN